ncbi:Exodeoxyribonuclease 8 [Pirellula sp. SH-Sr6A]|uniref:PD-(D/E)XK nuclease-like domain-containing protein n=1 Tax=Pirellula sp. SH-Sr6A TaxID=1632865 RepID=UPI00078EB2FC|nr:PD-(D/E)XK nuclease-like domain-containing protein [Pirellula sp. SH-Sr6A]AMV30855.1 Exodeoxyribonuclease 8 [Pirellula sp. SH-Sr6A]AMV34381.1 Exodeoxyribonuclease 8 [Pirellula sp. SH-Sr6A]
MKSDAEYHADTSRISNSMMSLLKRSPRLFYQRYILGEAEEPTDAMRFGSYLHTLVLEPEEIPNRYYIAPKVDRRTKEGKAAWAQSQELAIGKELVTEADAQLASLCASSILWHQDFKLFAKLITESVIEERIDFTFANYDCRCKPDMVHVGSRLCFDIKTAKGASPAAFSKSVAEYGYHRQAAFYRHALQEKYGEYFRFLFVVVETSAPFESAIYELDFDAIEKGEQELETLIAEYRVRLANDDWSPEFSKGINTLSLPRWYQSGIYQYEGEQVSE